MCLIRQVSQSFDNSQDMNRTNSISLEQTGSDKSKDATFIEKFNQ